MKKIIVIMLLVFGLFSCGADEEKLISELKNKSQEVIENTIDELEKNNVIYYRKGLTFNNKNKEYKELSRFYYENGKINYYPFSIKDRSSSQFGIHFEHALIFCNNSSCILSPDGGTTTLSENIFFEKNNIGRSIDNRKEEIVKEFKKSGKTKENFIKDEIKKLKKEYQKYLNIKKYFVNGESQILFQTDNSEDKYLRESNCIDVKIYEVDNISKKIKGFFNDFLFKGYRYKFEKNKNIKNIYLCNSRFENDHFVVLKNKGENNIIYFIDIEKYLSGSNINKKEFLKKFILNKSSKNKKNNNLIKEELLVKNSLMLLPMITNDGKRYCYGNKNELFINKEKKLKINKGNFISCKLNKNGKFDIVVNTDNGLIFYYNEDYNKGSTDMTKLFSTTEGLKFLKNEEGKYLLKYNSDLFQLEFINGDKYQLKGEPLGYAIGYDKETKKGKFIYSVQGANDTTSIYLIEFEI